MLQYKKSLFVALFLIAGIFATAFTADTYAETEAVANGSANVTVHVVESSDEHTNDDSATPDPDPGDYTDDEPPTDDSGDEQESSDPIDDSGGASGDENPDDEFDGNNELDIAEDPEESAAAIDANNNTNGGNTPTTPDTGVPTDASSSTPTSIIFPVLLALFIILIIAIVVKVIRDARSGRIYRGPRHDPRLHTSSFAHLNFKHDQDRRLNFIRIARLAIIPGLAVFACVFFFSNNPADETDAATAYPYNITIENGGDYHIYVKQGEFARIAFSVKTTTDNPTGYTLAMDTDQQTLSTEGGSIDPVSTDTASADFTDNTWGFSTNGTTYSRVPRTHSTRAMLRKTNGASASGNSSVVYLGVKAGESLPVGDYTTTVNFSAQTNLVTKKLKLANANVATVTRISDGSTLKNNAKIYVGEQLKITNSADVAGITQAATVNGDSISNNSTITVSKNVTVATTDDSIHFLKNLAWLNEENKVSSNGDAILIKSQGKTWLVDAARGGSNDEQLNGKKVAAYLKSLGVNKLDYVLVTHWHTDHRGGLITLVNKGLIRQDTTIYLRGCNATQTKDTDYPTSCTSYLNKIKTRLADGAPNIVALHENESTRAALYSNGLDFGNFHIDFYNIDKDSKTGKIDYNPYRENLNSIGTKWTHKPSGKTTFLSGDFEYGNEAKYGSKIGKVDILKAGHHGSKTSNTYDFISTLNPSTVIITGVDVAKKNGESAKQQAAWAYVQQKGGSVYFTGSSTGEAIAVSFGSNKYALFKQGAKKDVMADAKTISSKKSYDGGLSYYQWGGGLTAWVRPKDKIGETKDYKTNGVNEYFVYVYDRLSSAGNLISQVDRCLEYKDNNHDLASYQFRFASDGLGGVAKNSKIKKVTSKNKATLCS